MRCPSAEGRDREMELLAGTILVEDHQRSAGDGGSIGGLREGAVLAGLPEEQALARLPPELPEIIHKFEMKKKGLVHIRGEERVPALADVG